MTMLKKNDRKKFLLTMYLILSITVMPLAPVHAANSSNSRADYFEFEGHFYDILTADSSECLTWDQARQLCEQENGHLVTINSREEEDFVFSLTMDRDLMQDWDGDVYNYAWIGGFSEAGSWKWVTGEKWDYPEIFGGALDSFGTDVEFIGLCITGVGWNCDMDREVRGHEANEAYHCAIVCEWENPCGLVIELDESKYWAYTGQEIRPVPVVRDKEGTVLTEGKDYSVSYHNNVDAGEAEVIVTGEGEFMGSVKKAFQIHPRDISECLVELPDGSEYPYTGEPVLPPVKVSYSDFVIPYLPELTFDMDYNGVNHTDKGEVTFTVRGQGNLTGETQLTFEIVEAFMWPIKDFAVTQKFGNYSKRMAKKGRPYHSGVDMVANDDWTIYAAGNGVVVYTGSSEGNGNHVIIEHTVNGKTFKSLYSHLSKIDCSLGKITAGSRIGVMGNTGNSTGAHLHFTFFTGASDDPLGYVTRKTDGLVLQHGNCTFYDPGYVIEHGKLPDME